jgi:hypothetical protein
MAAIPEIRSLIRRYLSSSVELQEFADLFEDHYSEMNLGNDAQALAFGDEVEAYLGRVSAGLINENELKVLLFPLSFDCPVSANLVVGSVQLFSVSLNQPAEGRAFPVQTVTSDTSRGVVFGSIQPLPA